MEREELTRRVGMIATLLAVMVLAACDTQPATSVTSTAATLNAKGQCNGSGYGGEWWYQLRNRSAGGEFVDAGPRHGYYCSQATGEVAFTAERIGGLTPGSHYDFRLLATWNGSADHFDADGTAGGSNYDSFWTKEQVSVQDVSNQYPETFVSDTGEADAGAAGCKTKEIKNVRKAYSWVGGHLWTTELITRWRYCSNGAIVKMHPASAQCWPTGFGAASGWYCKDPNGVKVRATSLGGNPEHAVYTYSFRIERHPPAAPLPIIDTTRWCSTNQISGSGAHYRHGSCNILPW